MVNVNKILNLAVDAGEAAVDALGNPIGALAELFSPSLKAANEITQDKGSYEQLRAMMIKNGAKADEMEWSGADEFFQGQKTTRQEIADYLEANDPRLVPEVLEAEGVLGGSAPQAVGRVEREGLIQRTMEANPALVDEKTNQALELELENVYSNEYFGRDYIEPYFIEDSEIPEMAANSGKTVDEFKDLMEDAHYYSQNEDGSVSFFAENKKIKNTKLRDAALAKEILTHKYGGEDGLNKHLKIEVYDYFSDYYVTDPPGFYAEFGGAPPGSLSEGNTTHATYFPRGGDNYTEKLFQYRDPTGRIPIDELAGSTHFGDSNYGTIFHTRQADYPVEGGGTARYIGEIQSDPQQRLGEGDVLSSYADTLNLAETKLIRNQIQDVMAQKEITQKYLYDGMPDRDRARLGYEASIYDLNKKLKLGDQDLIRNIFGETMDLGTDSRGRPIEAKLRDISDYGEIPLSGEMTEAQEELVNAWIKGQPFKTERAAAPGSNWSNSNSAQYSVREYILDNDVDWLSSEFKTKFDNVLESNLRRDDELFSLNSQLGKAISSIPEEGLKSGPFMSSQNKWVDQALNQSILDAVNDPNIDYLTFPNDVEAIGQVGGVDPNYLKDGTVSFYTRDVQNRLKKLLGKFDKNVPIEEVNLEPLEVGGDGVSQFRRFPEFSSKGIRVTPEFREAVRTKGVPTAVVAPFVGYGALDAISEDENTGGAI